MLKFCGKLNWLGLAPQEKQASERKLELSPDSGNKVDDVVDVVADAVTDAMAMAPGVESRVSATKKHTPLSKLALPQRVKRSLGALALVMGASVLALGTTGCSTTVPKDPNNICSIFQEKDSWYAAAHKVHQRYGVPINVAMAIMHQESGFVDDAQPPMRWFLIVPYGRGSSAYGYAQAQDEVWNDYVKDAGSFFSSRDDFEDSLLFIGWYMSKTKATNKIPFADAYNQYLNYHEGWKGYRQGTYKSKSWLIKTAKEVSQQADLYRQQLMRCQLY